MPTGLHAVSSVPDGIGPKSATCLIIRHRCQKIRHAKNRRIGVNRLFLICCICGMLFKSKNIDANKAVVSLKDYKDMQYDKMAQMLRENIDLNRIYNIMGIKNV
mgnify:CR=1 FL=1